MADPIKAVCARDYFPADKSSGSRKPSEIRWIVLHSTEGGTAKSVARYFQSASSGGSTHLVVDDLECQRCLNDSTVSWGAKGANRYGFHIEQCGFAKWTTLEWRQHDKTLRRAAYKTAVHCKKFGIPVRFISAADLKENRKGITTHVECSRAFGGTHWDPGKGWPQDLFMRYVKEYHAELET
jgi:N-acetylmuramoyl-L-alanine amidase